MQAFLYNAPPFKLGYVSARLGPDHRYRPAAAGCSRLWARQSRSRAGLQCATEAVRCLGRAAHPPALSVMHRPVAALTLEDGAPFERRGGRCRYPTPAVAAVKINHRFVSRRPRTSAATGRNSRGYL